MAKLHSARCAAQALRLRDDGRPPRKICLLPAPVGGKIRGVDGRTWHLPDPAAVLQYVQRKGGLTLDLDHADEDRDRALDRPFSPTLGHILAEDVSLNASGEIWAEPRWTDMAPAAIASGRLNGVSPAVVYAPAPEGSDVLGTVVGLSSAGLVSDTPNFDLPVSLNAAQGSKMHDELRKLLGLPEGTPEAEILAAAKAQLGAQTETVEAAPAETAETAPAAPPVPLEAAFAPPAAPAEAVAPNAADEAPAWAKSMLERMDALEAASKAGQTVATNAAEAHAVAVNSAIDSFVSQGKLPATPEAKAFAQSQCATADGLKAFVSYYQQAPTMVPTAVGLNGSAPVADSPDLALTEDQIKMAEAFGHDPREIAKEIK